MASARKNSRSNATSRRRPQKTGESRYVVCVRNRGYEVSLEKRKLYTRLPDRQAERDGLIRVIDESGEDYLFPADAFMPIALPREVEKALRIAS